jgi:hypothetical protein
MDLLLWEYFYCQEHKQRILGLQQQLKDSKHNYSSSLRNLEGISDEIHEMRKSRSLLDLCLSPRQDGVGAESPLSTFDNAFTTDCSQPNEVKQKLEAEIDETVDETSEEQTVETNTD